MSAPKLLLVEDDIALAELLEYRFENEGYRVRATGDGDEALVLASEDTPDLVILEARSERQPALEDTVRSLEPTRLPVWLSFPRAPRTIEWLERRGRRTRELDPGLLEITRW